MAEELIYDLPGEDALFLRLGDFVSDPHTARYLHAPFARDHGGSRVTPLGLVMSWQIACGDYARKHDLSQMVDRTLAMSMAGYLRAMTDEGPFRDRVIKYLAAMGLNTD
jgi:hypothetical protein